MKLENNPLLPKIVRCLILGLSFLCLVTIVGMGTRNAHQFIFFLSIVMILGLLLRNVWLTLFLWWTCFLYIYFKFNIGQVYLQNIFIGCLLYYITKVAFRKSDIDFFLKGFLWVVALNILYIVIQILGYDFIYIQEEFIEGVSHLSKNTKPIGFMGFTGGMGMMMVLAIPILATRPLKYAKIVSLLLFIPLWLSQSSANVLAGVIGYLFVIYFSIPRKKWLLITLVIVSFGLFYTIKIDQPNKQRLSQWEMSLKEAVLHPVIGWGLNSFAHRTENKNHVFAVEEYRDKERLVILQWDNPHNLYISLLYEWGVLGLFLLLGYARQLGIWFRKAIKDRNTVGLAGFLLVVFALSGAHFPMFLARLCVLIIPIAALFELQVRRDL